MNKVGDIFFKNDEPYIVTKITLGRSYEVESEPLKDFVSNATIVMCDGRYMTINEAISTRMMDCIVNGNVIKGGLNEILRSMQT